MQLYIFFSEDYVLIGDPAIFKLFLKNLGSCKVWMHLVSDCVVAVMLHIVVTVNTVISGALLLISFGTSRWLDQGFQLFVAHTPSQFLKFQVWQSVFLLFFPHLQFKHFKFMFQWGFLVVLLLQFLFNLLLLIFLYFPILLNFLFQFLQFLIGDLFLNGLLVFIIVLHWILYEFGNFPHSMVKLY